MEHYDWNEGWLFAPTFDPALVRPECPELSLTPVRLPHTVKPLPYNYCSENDYQRLCEQPGPHFPVSLLQIPHYLLSVYP